MQAPGWMLTAISSAFLVSACGNSVSGTYADDGNVTAYEFHGDGRATISVLGTSVAAEYTIDDDRILVTSAQGTVVLKRSGERLYGPMGLELTRKPAAGNRSNP
jgi:hypothetical protein